MAPKAQPSDRRLSPLRDLFRSRRSSNRTDGDTTGAPSASDSSSRALQPSTLLTVPTLSAAGQITQTDDSTVDSANQVVQTSLATSSDLQPFTARSTTSAALHTRPPIPQQNSPSVIPTGLVVGPQSGDLWSKAVNSIDPQTLQKWKASGLNVETAAQDQNVVLILERVKERARLQQSKVWKQRWSSLVKSISTFKSLVDAGLHFDPTGYGAFAWSILSFGLEVAISGDEIDDDVANSCDYIRSTIDAFSMYEARYLSVDSKGRQALENCIVDVYKAVITYAAEIHYYINHRTDRISRAVRGSSESSLIEIRVAIEERSVAARTIIADVRYEVSDRLLNDIQSKIDELLSKSHDMSKIVGFIDEQERQKILNSISTMQMDAVHIVQRDKAEAHDRPNPGAWILNNLDYVNWKAADKSFPLWLSSGVGTGKTILASTIIEAHIKSFPGPVAYFYCSGAPGSEATDITAENILKSILQQFASRSSVAFAVIVKKWKETIPPGIKSLTRREVLALLRTIIEHEEVVEVTIIIDGLDELSAATLKVLLDALATLLEKSRGILKIFAASRWVQRVEDIFADGLRIENIASQTREDMMLYIESAVNAEIRSKPSLDQDLVDEIKHTLTVRANGMFRYIELAIKYIFDSTTRRIRERLENLPYPASGDAVLRPIYEKLYEEIENNDPVDRLLAHRVIQWLLNQFWPLTDHALLDAVYYGADDEVSSEIRKSHIGIDEVKAACHHLVVHNVTAGRFEFGHISVVEFIHWRRSLTLSATEGHSTLSSACLAFVFQQTPKIGESLRFSFGQQPTVCPILNGVYDRVGTFEHYALLSWPAHWREASQRSPSDSLKFAFDRVWTSLDLLQACFETINSTVTKIDPSDAALSAGLSRLGSTFFVWTVLAPILVRLHADPPSQRWLFACGQDLFPVIDQLLERYASNRSNAQSLMLVPGIKIALALGSTRVLEQVHYNFFDFSRLYISGTSLLHHAANLQSFRSTLLCLELYPDAVNMQSTGALRDEWVSTPFLMSLRSLQTSNRRGLQSEGVETEGLEEFLNLFLKRPGLDFHASDVKGRSALHLALQGNVGPSIIETFIKKDPTAVFRRDIDGQSPLLIAAHAADRGGSEKNLLLVRAPSYDAHDLHDAARAGDLDALINAISRFDPNSEHSKQCLIQALLFAAENQNMGCMRTLLDLPHLGVNDQDESGFSALMVAVIAGKEYVVYKLRLQGADVTLETRTGLNALFFAIKEGRIPTLKALILPMAQSVFDINHRDSRRGRTILHYACERGAVKTRNVGVLTAVLAHNPDLKIKDHEGATARELARTNGLFHLLPLLNAVESSSSSAFEDAGSEMDWSHSTSMPMVPENTSIHGTSLADPGVEDIGSLYSFESFDVLLKRLANPH